MTSVDYDVFGLCKVGTVSSKPAPSSSRERYGVPSRCISSQDHPTLQPSVSFPYSTSFLHSLPIISNIPTSYRPLHLFLARTKLFSPPITQYLHFALHLTSFCALVHLILPHPSSHRACCPSPRQHLVLTGPQRSQLSPCLISEMQHGLREPR